MDINASIPATSLLRILDLLTKACQNVFKRDIAMPTLTIENINAAIVGFEEQKRRPDEQIAELRSLLRERRHHLSRRTVQEER